MRFDVKLRNRFIICEKYFLFSRVNQPQTEVEDGLLLKFFTFHGIVLNVFCRYIQDTTKMKSFSLFRYLFSDDFDIKKKRTYDRLLCYLAKRKKMR
jgi:hypothetical protein